MAIIFILSFALSIAYILFVFSLYIRRWHDLGHSGWMSLLAFIPFVNLAALIYLMCAKGNDSVNEYGEVNLGKPFWRSLFAPGSLKAATVAAVTPMAAPAVPTVQTPPPPQMPPPAQPPMPQ